MLSTLLQYRRSTAYGIVRTLCCATMLVASGCDKSPSATAPGTVQETIAPAKPPSASQAMDLLYPEGPGQGRKLSLLGTSELPGGASQSQIVFIACGAVDSTPVDGLDVGAVVFVSDGDRWRAELVQPHVGIVAEERMTDDPVVISRVDIGSESVAFLVPDGSSNQGIAVNGMHMFAYEKGRFADFGFVQTGEENGGNCADDEEGKALGRAPCWEYSGEIIVQPGARPDHHDLRIKRTGTRLVKGAVGSVSDIVCTFVGKKYACPES